MFCFFLKWSKLLMSVAPSQKPLCFISCSVGALHTSGLLRSHPGGRAAFHHALASQTSHCNTYFPVAYLVHLAALTWCRFKWLYDTLWHVMKTLTEILCVSSSTHSELRFLWGLSTSPGRYIIHWHSWVAGAVLIAIKQQSPLSRSLRQGTRWCSHRQSPRRNETPCT